MSNLIKDVIKKAGFKPKKYEIKNNCIIYTDENEKMYVSKKNTNDIASMYNYLTSRGFNYLPKLVYTNNDGYIYEYVSDLNVPNDQKISDIVKLDALLHNKTSYFKEISLDEIKKVYEDLNNKIEDTFNYYDNVINNIESKLYISPSEYMLSRNCSSIFSCINFCKHELDSWYNKVKVMQKKREVLLHNNLDVNHIFISDNDIIISWDKAVRDMPIYDFIKLYKKNYNRYDFSYLYKEYTKRFPLLQEEEMLLFIILFIPKKILFSSNEFNNTKNISDLCNYLYKTDKLFMENKTKYSKEQNDNINEEQKDVKSNT